MSVPYSSIIKQIKEHESLVKSVVLTIYRTIEIFKRGKNMFHLRKDVYDGHSKHFNRVKRAMMQYNF